MTSIEFQARVANHRLYLAGLQDAPSQYAAGQAAANRRRNATLANEAITTAVSEAIEHGHLSIASVLMVVEATLRNQGSPLTPRVGYSLVSFTQADCDLLALTLNRCGRQDEITALRDRLSKMLATIRLTA